MQQGQLTKMYMGLLESSPEIGQLLVRLHDRHKLHQLSINPNEDTRGELANIMADLIELDLKPQESEIISDVLISLLAQAELDLRAALAERIAVMEGIPLRMVLHMANDEIDVSRPVLEKSTVLTDMDLIYIIKSKTPEHWEAIARRSKMSDALVDVLVNTKDMATATALADNKAIILTPHAIERMTHMARFSDDLAKPFISRREIPEAVVTKLYQYVGRNLKSYIRDHFSIANVDAVDGAIDDIVFQITTPNTKNLISSVEMLILAEHMMEKGFLTADVMIDNLRRGQLINFVAQFSIYCGVPEDTVREILSQKSAQGLAIACRATGIQKPEFVNIFLLTHRFRNSVDRVINKEELGLALRYYERVTERMARDILNQSRN